MLRRVLVENYRCFRRAEIVVPSTGLVVLIGPNAAGKSAVLEALDFVARSVREPGGFQEASAVRGGIRDFVPWETSLTPTITLELSGGVFEPDGKQVAYALGVKDDGGRAAIVREEAHVWKNEGNSKPMLILSGGGGGRRLRNVVTGLMDEGGGSGDESIVSRVAQEGPYPTPVHIRQAVGASVAYGGFVTAPGWLQLPFERSEGPRTPLLGQPVRHLHPRGLDLVNALRSIREDHSDSFKRLEEDFRNEFPFVKDISFPMVPGGRQVLRWKHTGHALPLYLDHFSSGMLAYLCILAAVYAQDSPAWIAFDEPEVHLHPALLRSAVAVLEARAAKTPVLIATHSDALLDFITDPASAVHVVEVAAKKSTIRTLRRESLDAWRTEYRLSELRARGHLDHLPPRG